MCVTHALQDTTVSVDHAALMLAKQEALLTKITSAPPPSMLQTAPAKKAAVKALVAAQQAQAAAYKPDGKNRDSFTIKGLAPPRRP